MIAWASTRNCAGYLPCSWRQSGTHDVAQSVDYIEAIGVERILVEKGQATAVFWKTVRYQGAQIYCFKRQSSGNIIKFVGRENLEPEFADRVASFRFSKRRRICD